MLELPYPVDADPVTWMENDGFIFEQVPGTDILICTPKPEEGVWVMGRSPDECRREWFRLSKTWPLYHGPPAPEDGEEETDE